MLDPQNHSSVRPADPFKCGPMYDALAAIARVRVLHAERVEPLTGARWCDWCDVNVNDDDEASVASWPCPTIAALDGTAS